MNSLASNRFETTLITIRYPMVIYKLPYFITIVLQIFLSYKFVT